ncbi:hypothetical protein [Methyloceanibacter caenitepidi]|uniref:Uncharacterized protein n=1 Tax=Methyloceanibacter caenitepidi TaxID=1384459 RepID=A0A0A8K352_9HYPH|nr:hypothetical protein [Methyloceanibacter caenitepidi]BAQ16957.1 hypothetical protein GL4_1501 [Methyloceanibacter caenitepidi]
MTETCRRTLNSVGEVAKLHHQLARTNPNDHIAFATTIIAHGGAILASVVGERGAALTLYETADRLAVKGQSSAESLADLLARFEPLPEPKTPAAAAPPRWARLRRLSRILLFVWIPGAAVGLLLAKLLVFALQSVGLM